MTKFLSARRQEDGGGRSVEAWRATLSVVGGTYPVSLWIQTLSENVQNKTSHHTPSTFEEGIYLDP